jgi:hypothetical protein
MWQRIQLFHHKSKDICLQPFLTDAVQSGLPSLWQHESYIHHNTIVGYYHSIWPLDHDDGSCFYEDSYNFLVYGGKKII